MTRQESIRRLARFMGGKKTYLYAPWYMIGSSTWNPFTRLDYAIAVAEKIGTFKLDKYPQDYRATLYTPGGVHLALGNTLPEAISYAALRYLDATEKK